MKLLSSGRRWDVYIQEENWIIYAIKKAKDESKKASIQREITILKFLKWKVNFVPQILDYQDNWFKYEFIEWKTLNKIQNPSKEIYKQLVKYAWELDKLKVEHGELSRPTKNIIISPKEKVFIIDFERWNLMNNSFKNLRAIWQFLANQKIISYEELKNIVKEKEWEKIKNFLLSKLES